MTKDKTVSNKASRNYYLDLVSFFPFVFLLTSGIIVLRYHGGMEYDVKTWGIDGTIWLTIHRFSSLFVIPLISVHLWFHRKWIQKIFKIKKKGKGKNHDINLIFLSVFILCALTGLGAWLVFSGQEAADLLREVHNKFGLILIFFFLIHMINNFKWLIKMTRKKFGKDN